jgi:hypothetical protein
LPTVTIREVRRRAAEEVVDTSFWGSENRRRFPFSGSILVDLSVLAVAALVVSTIVGLALLWPHSKLPRSASLGPIRTRAAVAQDVERRPCTISASHVCRLVRVKLLDGPERGKTTLLTTVAAAGALNVSPGDKIRVYKNPRPPGAATRTAGRKSMHTRSRISTAAA